MASSARKPSSQVSVGPGIPRQVSINSAVSEGGFVDVFFSDNSIVNEPGNDLVVFERSGPLGAGTPDPREVFGLSVFDGAAFTSFLQFVPVDTGFRTFEDGNPTGIFAAAVDLSSFGLAPGATIEVVRLHIFNANLGTKSADVTAVGALHSGAAVPQPSTANLLAMGILVLARIARRSRKRTWRLSKADSIGARPTGPLTPRR